MIETAGCRVDWKHWVEVNTEYSDPSFWIIFLEVI